MPLALIDENCCLTLAHYWQGGQVRGWDRTCDSMIPDTCLSMHGYCLPFLQSSVLLRSKMQSEWALVQNIWQHWAAHWITWHFKKPECPHEMQTRFRRTRQTLEDTHYVLSGATAYALHMEVNRHQLLAHILVLLCLYFDMGYTYKGKTFAVAYGRLQLEMPN